MLFFLNLLVDVADSYCDDDDSNDEILVLRYVCLKFGGSNSAAI
jgi:hypothetical protein